MIDPTEYEWFVPLYVRGEHLEDIRAAVNVARRTANRRPWSDSTISSVANRLRKVGVRLPRKTFREKLSDRTPGVARLNAIIDRLEGGKVAATEPLPPAPSRPAPGVDPREAVRKVFEELRKERGGE